MLKIANKTLVLASVWTVVFCAHSFAGELFDDFTRDELAEDVWWIKTTGKAVTEVKSGELILSSTGVGDSIYLFYREPIPPGEPITVEVRINLMGNPDDGWWGFLRDFTGDSHVNTIINDMKDATMFFVSGGGGSAMPRGEDGNRAGDVRIDAEEFHIMKIEVTDKKYFMEIDGEEVHDGDRTDGTYTNRVFYITPDGFDSHYGPASYVVDWIRLIGPTIPDRHIAVEPLSKLPIAWGRIKRLR